MRIIGISLVFLCLFGSAVKAVVPTWSVTPSGYTYSMNVTTKLSVECLDLTNPSNLVGAFIGGQCRGVINTSNIISGNYLAFLTVYSNIVSGDTVTFKIYDATLDLEYVAVTTAIFQDGAAYGFPTTPFTVATNNRPTDIALSNTLVDENAMNVFVGVLSSVDLDVLQTHTYSFVAGTGDVNNANFTISNDSIYVNGILDYETLASYSIRIVTNDGGCTFEKVFAITVNDLNDAPTAILINANSINENNSINTIVANLTSVDVDVNDFHTYTLIPGVGDTDNVKFNISGSTLRASVVFDFEAQDTLYVRLQTTDSGNNSVEQAFIILVNDINDVPTNLSLSTYNIYENIAIGSTLATFTTADQDVFDAHSYSFISTPGSDNASFTIVGSDIRNNMVFDYETKNIYYIYVSTDDGNGGQYNTQLIINIVDTNDAPTDITLSNSLVWENSAIGTYIGSFTSADQDAIDSYTYALTTLGPDDASFTVSNDSIFTNTLFNYNIQNTYNIQISTTDAGGLAFTKNFAIHIKNANDAPTDIYLSGNTIAENLSVGSLIATLTSADVDSLDVHTYSLVSGLGDVDNASFSISADQLVTNAMFDFEVKDTFSIRLQTKDFADSTFQKAFNIIILDVNDLPTDIVLSTDTFSENLSLNTSILTLSTVDQDTANTHSYAFDNAQNSDNALFTLVGNELRTNYLFNYELNNTYFVYITTNDGQGGTFTKQFILSVRDENDAPTAQALSNNQLAENNSPTTYIGKLTTTDEDVNDQFAYTLITGNGSTDNASFSISNDSLFTIDSLDFETKNNYSILVQSTDLAGISITQQYTINVVNGNDIPTALQITFNEIDENNPIQAIIGSFFTTDEDAADIHTYQLVSGTGGDDNSLFFVDVNNLKINKVTDFETKNVYSILVQTNDGNGGTLQQQITINVIDVNERPLISDTTIAVSENASLDFVLGTISYSDEDNGDSHIFSIVNEPTFVMDNNNVLLNAALNYETINSYTLAVVVEDATGLTDTAIVTVNVLDEVELGTPLPANNIISPNGDAKNDFFMINNVRIYEDYSLTIFNNAGHVIYNVSSGYDNSWGGTYNGKLVEQGVYYYLLQNNTDNSIFYKGTISLIR